MDSIANFAHVRKRANISKTAHCTVVRGSADYWQKVNMSGLRGREGADGTIKGLSNNSLARLRDAIARTGHKSGDYCIYGSCLTIPWRDVTQEEGAEIWRTFTHHLGRLLDKYQIGGIYRVELQKRGAVHWHTMLYLPASLQATQTEMLLRLVDRARVLEPDSEIPLPSSVLKKTKRPIIDIGDDVAGRYAYGIALQLLRSEWIAALQQWRDARRRAAHTPADAEAPTGVARCLAPVRTWRYCMDAIPLNSVKSGIAYLASHTAKHKQEQLGYRGKQWGYLGRKWLTQPEPLKLTGDDLDYGARVRLYRLLRRWIRRNRRHSDWRVVRPSRRVLDGAVVHGGLVIHNTRTLYLFGLPGEVVKQAINCIDGGARHV